MSRLISSDPPTLSQLCLVVVSDLPFTVAITGLTCRQKTDRRSGGCGKASISCVGVETDLLPAEGEGLLGRLQGTT